MRQRKKSTYIDLFAGCGGLSLGLYKSGWQGLFAIEKSSDAFKTLKHNLIDKKQHFSWPKWLPRQALEINDITRKYKKELMDLRGRVDLVAGGPPCQGFSTAGRRNENDKRNNLINSYIEFIKIVRPKIIFFENVKGFTLQFQRSKSKGRRYSEYVKECLKDLGYEVHGEILDFSEFGVPQTRHRFILIGVQRDRKKSIDPKLFFDAIYKKRKSFLRDKGIEAGVTIADAISDLERKNGEQLSLDTNGFMAGVYGKAKNKYQEFMREESFEKAPDSHRFAKHTKEIEKRFKVILKKSLNNHQIIERFNLKKLSTKRLEKDKPSPTLTTLPDDYIHYNEPRIMTVREYARIQTFPDWFEFKGKYTTGGKHRVVEVPRYTQIGNAIPPLFGEQVGITLNQILR
ncbi:DNA cytosine methyltransferase [Candidatus Parcubacteria bacterium]|nr:DNA cytosine methyltransferase [Candidatus Parcubacteria bacterium]